VNWFDDLYAVEYVDGVVNGLRTAFRFIFQLSLQVLLHRYRLTGIIIPVSQVL
jgi:hypothetical protein